MARTPIFHRVGIFLAVVLCALAMVAAWHWWVGTDAPVQPGTAEAVLATPAPQLAVSPLAVIEVTAPIKARAPTAKKALKLPETIQADQAQHVLDAARIAPSDHAQTVTAVLDTATGETHTYVVAEPLPWIDFRQRGDVGAYLGIKRGAPTLRIQARHELAQIKSIHLGALASADIPINGNQISPELFIGVGAWVGW